MTDHVHYSPAQIAEALGNIETQRKIFEDAALNVQKLYEALAAASSGTSIQSAVDAQNQSNSLRQETNENVMRVKAEGQRSLERVQQDDSRFSSILGA